MSAEVTNAPSASESPATETVGHTAFRTIPPSGVLNAEVAREYPREVLAGVIVCSKLTGAKHTWIAVDARTSAAQRLPLRRLARRSPAKIVTIANDYPQADPTLLLYTLLGRR